MKSLISLFEEKGGGAPVSGLKPYTGHLGAASDIAEVIFGILAVKDGIVPATLNFQKTEEQFSALDISGEEQPCRSSRFLSVSYGVGGQASSVVVEVS
jgi:3-oxoacyl-[acyl-carrier-protein] synthase II